MKVLLINHYAGSPSHGMEFRPYELGTRWARSGNEVTIVAASYSHVRTSQPTVSRSAVTEYIGGVRYIWIPVPRYAGNGVKRALNVFAFVHRARSLVDRLSREWRPDVAIASSTYPLDILVAEAAARADHTAIIFEVHDLWPLSPIELGGMSASHPFIRLMQWSEERAYSRADKVVSLLPCTREYMIGRGMAPEKFVYIPNGVDTRRTAATTDCAPAIHREAILRESRAGRLVVGYAGAHGVANGLDVVLDAAELLRGMPVSFVLVGDGSERQALVQRATRSGLDNVLFLPPVPRNEVDAVLHLFDVGLLTLQPQPLFRFGISPNKLMDYMLVGLPVIQAVAAGNDIVGDAGCGVTVPPGNAEALAGAVRTFVSMPHTQLHDMGSRGRAYVLEHHDYDGLAARFASTMAGVLASKRR